MLSHCVQLRKTCRKRVCNATYYVSRLWLCTECRCDEEVWETIRQHQYQRESARRVLQPGYNRPATRATTLLHVTSAESLSCTCYKTGSFVHQPSSLSLSRS